MDGTSDYFSRARTDISPLLPQRIHSILEIGCGTGATMAWIRGIRQVEYAVGVELSASAARQAESAFDKILAVNIETSDLQFSTSFDVILALDVLEHLVNPWLIAKKLRQILTPNGVVVASIPNVAHYKAVFPLFFRGSWHYEDSGILDRTHLRFFTKETALELFTSANFLIEQVNYVRIYPNLFPNTHRGRWYSRKIMSKIFPERLANAQFLIRARSRENGRLL